MNDCHGPVAQEVRPGTARVLVTELSGSDYINPTPVPKPCEDFDTEVDLYLSPERLESLCGTQDLSHVTALEICVDTQENTLGNFGAYLPRLEQLRMNNSSITSVRDLGTTLSNLQVLSMFRCCLQDLDGISSFTSLKELYVAYNNVSDLSPVGMLENLQLLDLEGNDVDDLVQVQYLGLCLQLQTLTLQGNPVCQRPNPFSTQVADYNYRAAVRELVPQLRYLDDAKAEEDRLTCCSMEEDMNMLRNTNKVYNSLKATSKEDTTGSGCPYSISGMQLSSSPAYIRPLSSAGFSPNTGSRSISVSTSGVFSPPGSRPGSSDSDLAAVEAETSVLIHGAGKILFCGNPVQAIRARREKLRTAPTRSTLISHDLPIHIPEHTYDLEEPDPGERVNVFAELRAWREQHSRRLQAIEKERKPQILAIHHDSEVETSDDAEDGFDGMRSNSSDEEWGEEKHRNSLDTGSLDSSIQSFSPDLHQQEALSPDISQLSLSPDNTFSPSPPTPPLSTTAEPANRRLPRIRARRLRLSQANSEHSLDSSRKGCTPGTDAPAAETDLIFQRVQQMTSSKVPVLPQSVHVPHPPPTCVLHGGLMDSGVDMDLSKVHSGDKKNISKIPDRPAISRPHTARAALQKHHQQHLLQPCRGSSHPD